MPKLLLAVKKVYAPPPAPEKMSEVQSGNDFGIGLTTYGKIKSLGLNSTGQLGDNSITNRTSPVLIGGNAKTFCKIDVGATYTLALDKNGRAWGWGNNTEGQLGDNTVNSRITPVSISGATKTFCNISAGNRHTTAIDKNGRVWGWGFNSTGQIGDNTLISKRTPVSISGATKTFCKISAGDTHTSAIDKNGRVWGWGNNQYGGLGDNSVIQKNTPVSILGTTKTFCNISAGGEYSMAIDKNGRLWSWGRNFNGELGDNTSLTKNTPVSVLGAVKTFCQIFAFNRYSLAIDKNGKAWSWGTNTEGQLGDNSTTARSTPVSVAGATKTFCKIFGANHILTIGNITYGVNNNGNVWGWGYSLFGGLGNSITDTKTPVSVKGAVKTFCTIDIGIHAQVIDKNGRVWGWGNNQFAQLGDNTITSKFTPVSISGATKTFCKITTGVIGFTLGIDKNGRVWGWGLNTTRQLGLGDTTSRRTPVSLAGAIKTFCHITAGVQHSAGIDKNGRVWAWGNNESGQLGDNSVTLRSTPVSISGATKTFCKIKASGSYTMAIDKNGRVWGWGLNTSGQLGDNTLISKRTPVSISGSTKTFCHIEAGTIAGGSAHTVAIDKNGRVWGWGLNSNGQLGNNSTTGRCTPVSVAGATKTFCKITAGNGYTMAIDKNGRLWGWGLNNYGQLGNNSITARCTPVSVAGATKTFCDVRITASTTLAVDKNGRLWAWGFYGEGRCGNNQNTSTPIQITFL